LLLTRKYSRYAVPFLHPSYFDRLPPHSFLRISEFSKKAPTPNSGLPVFVPQYPMEVDPVNSFSIIAHTSKK